MRIEQRELIEWMIENLDLFCGSEDAQTLDEFQKSRDPVSMERQITLTVAAFSTTETGKDDGSPIVDLKGACETLRFKAGRLCVAASKLEALQRALPAHGLKPPCSGGRFLEMTDDGNQAIDWYTCACPNGPGKIIGRFGPEDHEYWSSFGLDTVAKFGEPARYMIVGTRVGEKHGIFKSE